MTVAAAVTPCDTDKSAKGAAVHGLPLGKTRAC